MCYLQACLLLTAGLASLMSISGLPALMQHVWCQTCGSPMGGYLTVSLMQAVKIHAAAAFSQQSPPEDPQDIVQGPIIEQKMPTDPAITLFLLLSPGACVK